MKMEPVSALQIFTFLFLMLGPFKVVGPFAKITERAEPGLARRIALVSIPSTVITRHTERHSGVRPR
jgi:hypothetical protein